MLRRLFVITIALLLTASVPDDARKANKAYKSGDYDQAIKLYKQAITQQADQPKLYFNLGNALLKQEKYSEAIGAYESFKQRAKKAEMKARASYNIGNAYADQKEWQKAANYYREALKFDPRDEEAKHNYELALDKLKEQQKKNKKQQQQNQQNNKNNKNQDQKQNQQQKQNKNNNNQQKQDKQQQNQQKNQDQNKQQQNQQQQNSSDNNNSKNQQQQQSQPKPRSISKEVAQKILNALEDKEKDLLKKFKKQQTPKKSSNGKDW